MRPPRHFEYSFSLRSWIFGFGIGKDCHYGYEAYIGFGPFSVNWSQKL